MENMRKGIGIKKAYRQLDLETYLYISADDYYKLYANGSIVCQGPAPSGSYGGISSCNRRENPLFLWQKTMFCKDSHKKIRMA